MQEKSLLAKDLAKFLKVLHDIDSSNGPQPGPHNFYRGGDLRVYDSETRQAIDSLSEAIDGHRATAIWEKALKSHWRDSPVWVHGDISVGNLLVKDDILTAVIDFGMLAVGDPACDLAIAWTYFEGESYAIFKAMLPLDEDTWNRARAWTLWKALITATKPHTSQYSNSIELIHKLI